jgi:hypothetical protein
MVIRAHSSLLITPGAVDESSRTRSTSYRKAHGQTRECVAYLEYESVPSRAPIDKLPNM